MPKKRTDEKLKQESIGLPPKIWALIDELADSGFYGGSRGEATRQLILDQLKIVARERILAAKPKT